MEKTADMKEEIVVLDSGIGEDFFSNMSCCTGVPMAKGGN